ncbi:MAG TPA: Imm27 family immunity protein [Steroidobacteraceae bacterium]|nr:Imm27 family immunity protein [Steroidobacteraceae bacterium]
MTTQRFAPLGPDETEVHGTAHRDLDDPSQRIQWLIETALERITADQDGWTVLYRDPTDGRFWELSYPQSHLHGGGPPRLCLIDRDRACKTYGAAFVSQAPPSASE